MLTAILVFLVLMFLGMPVAFAIGRCSARAVVGICTNGSRGTSAQPVASSGAATQPKVAPVKKMGTISPPLKPAPKVSAVNSIFSRNAYGTASPLMAASMTAAPAPC